MLYSQSLSYMHQDPYCKRSAAFILSGTSSCNPSSPSSIARLCKSRMSRMRLFFIVQSRTENLEFERCTVINPVEGYPRQRRGAVGEGASLALLRLHAGRDSLGQESGAASCSLSDALLIMMCEKSGLPRFHMSAHTTPRRETPGPRAIE